MLALTKHRLFYGDLDHVTGIIVTTADAPDHVTGIVRAGRGHVIVIAVVVRVDHDQDRTNQSEKRKAFHLSKKDMLAVSAL